MGMRERMRGFRELVTVQAAVARLRSSISHRINELEEVDLLSAPGRICGEEVLAPSDSPPFDRSAMDGYAVVAEDTFGASPMNPIELKILGKVEAGMKPSDLPKLERGMAIEIFTGAPIPPGASAVVPAEFVKKKNHLIEVYQQVHPHQNISKQGEDFSKGELILKRGELIKPWHIGAVASFGITKLKVLRKPRIALLSTGNELIEADSPREPGLIYNSTKPMLAAMLSSVGAQPIDLGIVRDDVDEIKRKIAEGIRETDGVIVTGGTSVGARDLVPEAVSKIGRIEVHGLSIRPGKPTGFAIVDGKPVFMLSGFPVAALIGFQVLVKPAIEQLLECRFDPLPKIRGKLTRRVASPPRIRSFVRVKVFMGRGGEVLIEPLRVTGSGILSTLTRGNGVLVIPEDLEGYEEGEEVEVELFSHLTESDERGRI